MKLPIRTTDVHLSKQCLIPLAGKIIPLIELLYNSANEYLLNLNGKPLHLPHDERRICAPDCGD